MKLEDFCGSEDDPRWILHTPFTFGEWTYATDGAIAVRVPAMPDYPMAGADHKIAAKCADFFEKTTPVEPLPGMPAFERPMPKLCDCCDGNGSVTECAACRGEGGDYNDVENEWSDCDECNGRGFFPGGAVKCEECNGEGNLKWMTPVRIGENWITLHYLERIERLPSLRAGWLPFDGGYPVEANQKILRFAFDGGEGLLMPIRAPHKTEKESAT